MPSGTEISVVNVHRDGTSIMVSVIQLVINAIPGTAILESACLAIMGMF